MPMIRETIVTTVDASGRVHVAPFGLIVEAAKWIIAPFRPSTTLDNLLAVPFAVANLTDDVRVFAGCVCGHRAWPLAPLADFAVPRLAVSLAHAELAVEAIEDDGERPRFLCQVRRIEQHQAFLGLNRAKAAVVEASILTSRLKFLSREKIEREMAQLKIAIDKTAGPEELEAWGWLVEKIDAHYARAAT